MPTLRADSTPEPGNALSTFGGVVAGGVAGLLVAGPLGAAVGVGAVAGTKVVSRQRAASDEQQSASLSLKEKASVGAAALVLAGPPGIVFACLATGASYMGNQKVGAMSDSWWEDVRVHVESVEELRPRHNEIARLRTGLGLGDEEADFLAKRDARTSVALRKFLGQEHFDRASGCAGSSRPLRVAFCGSGGGYRAMVSFGAALAAAEECGLLDCLTYVSALSGATWTLGQWYTLAVPEPVREKRREYQERSEPIEPEPNKESYFLQHAPIMRVQCDACGFSRNMWVSESNASSRPCDHADRGCTGQLLVAFVGLKSRIPPELLSQRCTCSVGDERERQSEPEFTVKGGDRALQRSALQEYMERQRERIQFDLRLPPAGWLCSPHTMKEEWVTHWLTTRRFRGHPASTVDWWGALLTYHLLQEDRDVTLADQAFACDNGALPLPIYTACSRRLLAGASRRMGDSESETCLQCRACFGIGVTHSRRHHCKACGRLVCEKCSRHRAVLGQGVDRGEEEVRICDRCWQTRSFEEVPAQAGSDGWDWWEFTPFEVRQLQSRVSQRVSDDRAEEDLPPGVRAAACPAWAFGRRFKQGTSCSSSGEDGVGRILGVCGSAFCATLERVKEEGFLRPGATEAAMRAVLKRPKGDDHLFEPAEFHDPREELEAGRGTKPIRLVDGGFDFNHPLPPLLQPERALDVIIAFDYAEYRTGQRPGDVQGEWWRCIRNCRRNGLHLPPLEMDRLLEEPVSVFPGDESKGQPTLVVLHLFKVPGDPEDGFDPMGNAQAGGFCGVLSAKYTPEEYDTLVKFNRERLLSAVDKIKEAMLDRLRARG